MPYPRSPATEKTNITANKKLQSQAFPFPYTPSALIPSVSFLSPLTQRTLPVVFSFEEKTDIHARLLHGYFFVSFFNDRFYEFKFSLRFFTVIINPVPERLIV